MNSIPRNSVTEREAEALASLCDCRKLFVRANEFTVPITSSKIFVAFCTAKPDIIVILQFSFVLADRTAIQCDRRLASSCRPSARLSLCLSVTLCIVALKVGVQG